MYLHAYSHVYTLPTTTDIKFFGTDTMFDKLSINNYGFQNESGCQGGSSKWYPNRFETHMCEYFVGTNVLKSSSPTLNTSVLVL